MPILLPLRSDIYFKHIFCLVAVSSDFVFLIAVGPPPLCHRAKLFAIAIGMPSLLLWSVRSCASHTDTTTYTCSALACSPHISTNGHTDRRDRTHFSKRRKGKWKQRAKKTRPNGGTQATISIQPQQHNQKIYIKRKETRQQDLLGLIARSFARSLDFPHSLLLYTNFRRA